MQTRFNIYRKGDTWNGREYQFNFDITGVVFLIQFKFGAGLKPVFEYKTSDNTITVNLAAKKIFLIPRILNYPVGVYFYDLQLTFPSGKVKTYAPDKMTIFTDVSR